MNYTKIKISFPATVHGFASPTLDWRTVADSMFACRIFIFLSAFLLFTAGCALFTGCTQVFDQNHNYFSSEEKVEYLLPDWNKLRSDFDAMPQLALWKIEYTTYKESKILFANPAAKSLTIEVPKNYPCAIMAFPITEHAAGGEKKSSFFQPCGALYPMNRKSLSWDQGFSATILSLLYKNSGFKIETAEFLSLFNWVKFVEKNNTSASSNPWLLDKSEILKCIRDKKFNVYKLKLPSSVSLTGQNEIIQMLGGTKKLLSAYIPENYVLAKTDFLSIIKGAEYPGVFLWNDKIARISVTSSGNAKLTLCALPAFSED